MAVAQDRERDIHVVDDVGRRRAVQGAADGEDRAVGPHGRAGACLQRLDLLLEPPVERACRRGRAVGRDPCRRDGRTRSRPSGSAKRASRRGIASGANITFASENTTNSASVAATSVFMPCVFPCRAAATTTRMRSPNVAQDLRRAVGRRVDIDEQFEVRDRPRRIGEHVLRLGADDARLVVRADAERRRAAGGRLRLRISRRGRGRRPASARD